MLYKYLKFTPLGAFFTLFFLSACATPPEVKPLTDGPQPVAHADLGHEHIPFPEFPHDPYNSNPPSSGPHTAYTAPWGVHERPVANEVLIHNLEHGAVVIGYRCQHCPELVDALTELADGHKLVIIAPNPGLDTVVGLSAWAHTLTFDRLDDAARKAVAAFFARHHGIDHHPPGNHPHNAAPEGAGERQ